MKKSSQLIAITGASKGIGAAIWRTFAAAGHPTVGIARSTDQLAEIATQLQKAGHEADYLSADLGSTVSAAACARRLIKEFGLPHGVVFNAGTASHKCLLITDLATASLKWPLIISVPAPCSISYCLLAVRRNEVISWQ